MQYNLIKVPGIDQYCIEITSGEYEGITIRVQNLRCVGDEIRLSFDIVDKASGSKIDKSNDYYQTLASQLKPILTKILSTPETEIEAV